MTLPRQFHEAFWNTNAVLTTLYRQRRGHADSVLCDELICRYALCGRRCGRQSPGTADYCKYKSLGCAQQSCILLVPAFAMLGWEPATKHCGQSRQVG